MTMRYAGTCRSEHNPLRSMLLARSAAAFSSLADAESVAQAGHYMPTINCPDAALLMLCDELRILQVEWQRLWEATPEVSAAGPTDMALDDYSESVWPGGCRLDADREHDPVRNLITMQATTLEGMHHLYYRLNEYEQACSPAWLMLKGIAGDAYQAVEARL